MKEPSPRQRELLEFIHLYQTSRARPPSLVEMAEALGVSRTMARMHLGELYVKELAEHQVYSPRSVRLTAAGLKAIGARKAA